MSDLSRISGEGGSQYYDSTATLTLDMDQIYVATDAVFTVLTEIDGTTSTDVTGSSEQNVSGNTIPAGSILTPKRDMFATVAVSSGKLIIYRK